MGKILKMSCSALTPTEKTVTLVIGNQEIRTCSITPITNYIDTSLDSSGINSLVKSIHLAERQTENSYKSILYYTNCYDACICVMNKSIINLFKSNINAYVTDCGAIILWNHDRFYTTIDMQNLNLHKELKDFFKKYYIVQLFKTNDNANCILVQDRKTRVHQLFEIQAIVDLRSNCSVRINLSEKGPH